MLCIIAKCVMGSARMTSNEVKVIVGIFAAFAIMMVAVAIGDAYSSVPRQYGDKVCVKVQRELKCESIENSN